MGIEVGGGKPTAGELAVSLGMGTYGLTGTLSETFQRNLAGSATQASLVSATLRLAAIRLVAGQTVTNVGFRTGTTAANGPTHSLTGLYTYHATAPVRVATSADKTTDAIGASAFIAYAMTTPYVVPTTGLYYAALMVVATIAVPTTSGITAIPTGMNTDAPILSGNTSDGALTTTIPATAGTITPDLLTPYMYVT